MKQEQTKIVFTKPARRSEWLAAGANLCIAITGVALLTVNRAINLSTWDVFGFPVMLVLAMLVVLLIIDIRDLVTGNGRRIKTVGEMLVVVGFGVFLSLNGLGASIGAALILLGASVAFASHFVQRA